MGARTRWPGVVTESTEASLLLNRDSLMILSAKRLRIIKGCVKTVYRRGFPAGRQADVRGVLPGFVSSACGILMGEVPNICYTVLEPVCLELFGDEHEQREPDYCSCRR